MSLIPTTGSGGALSVSANATQSAQTSRADFASIPDCPGTTVFAFLSPQGLAAAARVCKSWSKFLENNVALWSEFSSRFDMQEGWQFTSQEPKEFNLLLSKKVAPENSQGIDRYCKLRGICEKEWRKLVQRKCGIYSLQTFASTLPGIMQVADLDTKLRGTNRYLIDYTPELWS